ncbi:hypothetical protein BH23ACT8_BH23ACT8_15760 [soil metagenome]
MKVRCRCGKLLDKLLADERWPGQPRVAIYSLLNPDHAARVFTMDHGVHARRWRCECGVDEIVRCGRLLAAMRVARDRPGRTVQLGVDC